MKYLITLLLGTSAFGQSLGIYCPAISPSVVVCSIASTAPGATTFQWTLSTNVANAKMNVTALAAGKSAAANGSQMLLVGMNATAIATGTVASVTINLPRGFSCSGNSPCLTLTLANVQATINNHPVNLTANPASVKVRVKK